MNTASRAPRNTFIRFAPAVFVLLWSTGYVGARYGLPHAEPLTLLSMRFVLVVVLLIAIVRLRGSRLPSSPRMLAHLMVAGVLIQACFTGGIFIAINRGVDIGVAALIAGLQPILTAAFAVALLKESLSGRAWLGFLLGFGGLALVVLQGITGANLSPLGLTACVVGLLGITLGTLYQKHFVTGVDVFAGALVQFVAAAIACGTLAFIFEAREVQWTPTLVAVLLWLSVVLSIGAMSILLLLIRDGAASRVSSLFYLVPPVTAAQGHILFGERLSVIQLAGIALTAVGVALISSTGTGGKP